MIKNYPVQGFATGDIVPVVLLEMDERLKPLKSCLVNTVHDSTVIDVHPQRNKLCNTNYKRYEQRLRPNHRGGI